jgi:hypothetical protein
MRMPNVVVVAILSVGCASMGNSPQQDATWAAMKPCDHFPGVSIDRVEPNGKYWVKQNNPGNWQRFQECVAQQRIDTSRARFVNSTPKDLIYHAYLIKESPPSGRLKDAPSPVTDFHADSPVSFYYVLWQSGRTLHAKFKWYRPDGTLAGQQDRSLRDSRTPGTTRTWFVQTLPSIQVQQSGTWALEFFIENQLIDRYNFTVT